MEGNKSPAGCFLLGGSNVSDLLPLSTYYTNMALGQYLRETREEMKHVSWPTRKQVISYTALVIVVSIITSLYLGLFDYFFQMLFKSVI